MLIGLWLPAGRPQFVRLGNCVTGAPEGTVLAPLYTTDLNYNSESCNIQKYFDDTAIVPYIKKWTGRGTQPHRDSTPSKPWLSEPAWHKPLLLPCFLLTYYDALLRHRQCEDKRCWFIIWASEGPAETRLIPNTMADQMPHHRWADFHWYRRYLGNRGVCLSSWKPLSHRWADKRGGTCVFDQLWKDEIAKFYTWD